MSNLSTIPIVLAQDSNVTPAPVNHSLNRSSSLAQEPDRVVSSSPSSSAASTTMWQSASLDLPERRVMVQRIMQLAKYKLRGNCSRIEWEARAPAIARRVELSLYSRAASRAEYVELTTLKRRLNAIVSASYQEASASLLLNKKKRTRRNEELDSTTRNSSKRLRKETNSYFLFTNEDVLRHIYSFVNGTDVLTSHVRVNRWTSANLKDFISVMHIDVTTLGRGITCLSQWPNLQDFAITNERTTSASANDIHSWSCPELEVTHSNAGEAVVSKVASVIASGKALRRLCKLRCLSLFTNTSATNAHKTLCEALIKSPLRHLEELYLGGNSISDAGMTDLAKALRGANLPSLVKLDLRRNCIGEGGVASLTKALVTGSSARNIKSLSLGGNIITDQSVEDFTTMLSSGACPSMRFLGLEDNFISSKGVAEIMKAAVSGGMLPKLHKMCRHKTANGTCKCTSRSGSTSQNGCTSSNQ